MHNHTQRSKAQLVFGIENLEASLIIKLKVMITT
jgi:hypothetical protein